MAQLRLPTPVVAGKLVHEDDGNAAANLLVVELHMIIGREMGHEASCPTLGLPGRKLKPHTPPVLQVLAVDATAAVAHAPSARRTSSTSRKRPQMRYRAAPPDGARSDLMSHLKRLA